MSARSLNKVLLIGNLTRDPELRYTPQGTAVCTFGLATNRDWTDSSGQKQEETEFHRIVSWQKLAELCSQLLFKGRKVFVEGRLQTRKWTGQDGQERQTTEVVIDNMIILDSRRREGEEGAMGFVPESQVGVMPTTVDNNKRGGGATDNVVVDSSGVGSDTTPVAKVGDSKAKKSSKTAKKTAKSEDVKAEDIPF